MLTRIARCFLVAALALIALGVVRADGDEPEATARAERLKGLEAKKTALYAKKLHDETGAVRMAAPKPGEWLYRFLESAQDEVDYKSECANKRRKGREKIYVTELGDVSERCKAVQGPLRDFLHAFFQLEVVPREAAKLPSRTYDVKRQQYDGDALLKLVARTVPDDALVSVGLLDKDIYTRGLNFVFGLGTLADRVGIYSFVRLQEGKDTAEALYRKRCFRLVAHEVGHILGMEHCVYYECVMNGVNSLEEDDTKPLHLCPVCQSKLIWNVDYVDLTREQELAALLAKQGINDEAKWSNDRILRLERDQKK